jgi:hypothetical protein
MTHLPLPLVLHPLLRRLRWPSRAAQRRFVMMDLAALDPLPLGPGWFDSSWELERGVEIREDAVLDAQLQTLFEAAPCRPVGAAPGRAGRGDSNLIEFDASDLDDVWRMSSERRRAAKSAGELELTLA